MVHSGRQFFHGTQTLLIVRVIILPIVPQHRATDLYQSFGIFAFMARVPALCSALSTMLFVVFMALAAFEDHPTGTTAILATAFLIITSNFSIYGLHFCLTYGTRALQSTWKAISRS
jgi:hypothetical protein